jgi:hypothetical protein
MRVAIATLAVLTLSIAIQPAHAQRWPAPHDSAYAGLLPEAHAPIEGTFDLTALRASTVAVVPSSNFNAYTEQWAATFDPEQVNRRSFAAAMGFNNENLASSRQATDPRAFPDRVIDVLLEHAGSIVVANDLVEARDSGATHFVIVDFWGAMTGMSMRYRSQGGVYILDGSLRQVLAISNESNVRQRTSSIFDDFTAGPARAQLEADMRTYSEGIAATTNPIIEQLRVRLASP